jgi:uncharacterized membrane protein (DUF485 family)
MTQAHATTAGRDGAPAEEATLAGDRQSEIDWIAAERSPEFRDLVKKKKAFVVPATIFFLAWYLGFILLAGYAPDFMGREFITDGLTVGYALALSQFVMVWGLAAWYLRKSDRVFDPLAKRAAQRALESSTTRAPGEGRFERGAAPVADEEVSRR